MISGTVGRSLRKIVDAALELDPQCSYIFLTHIDRSNPLLLKIYKKIHIQNIKCPSDLHRFIQRNNVHLASYFSSETSNEEDKNSKRARVLDCFKRLELNAEFLDDSAYKLICSKLDLSYKNLRTRKQIDYYYKKYFRNRYDKKCEIGPDVQSEQTIDRCMEEFPIEQLEFVYEENGISRVNNIVTVELPQLMEHTDFQQMSPEKKNACAMICSTPYKVDEKSIDSSVSHIVMETAKKNDVTPETFAIPKDLNNLSTDSDNEVLPRNAKNVDNLPLTSFKDCKIVEGTFNIDETRTNMIIKNGKLVDKYYPYYFRNRISKYVNNVCNIVMKFRKYNKSVVKIYAKCKNNNYNCKKFVIIIRNLHVIVYSSSLNFCHPVPVTSYVKGVERELAKKNILLKKPSEYKRKTILQANETLIKSGNLQAIKSDPTVRKMRSEAMAQWDRDSNDWMDLIKMQMDHEEYIKEVCIPFNVKIYSQEQFQVIDKSRVENDLPILYFDATGSIVKKPEGVLKRIYLYTAVIPTYSGRIFPVFEMISATHFAKTVYKIFNDFRSLCEENNKWPTFGAVVTDFSFPNLHAVSKSCNRCTLLEYITRCYSIVKGEIIFPESLVTIHLCCAHLMKIFCKDVEDKFADKNVGNFMKDAMALAINTQTLAQLEDWFINMAVILLSQFATERVYRSRKCISNGIEEMNEDSDKEANTLKSGNIYNEDDTEKDKSMYRMSPFYKHFSTLLSEIDLTDTSDRENEYYNKEFFNIILQKYIPFASLWTGIMLIYRGTSSRVSNTYVENYFGHLKKNILRGERNLKCSRFLRKSRENVLALHKEFILDIPKTKLARVAKNKDLNKEHFSEETWNKKVKTMNTHFRGAYLKNAIFSESVKPENDRNDPTDITNCENCIYCGLGILDTTVEWVACSKCERWLHQNCESSKLDKTYTGLFICKFCSSSNEFENVHLETKFTQFLQKLDADSIHRDFIQEMTKEQRKCAMWYSERKLRLTASNFGKVCKAKSSKVKQRILRDLDKNICTTGMKHGIDNEERAIAEYIKLTQNRYTKCGLVIHKTFSFLAGSPDGLINEDGIIEVKCPYKIRNEQLIKPRDLPYLDDDGNLKTNSDHYYQIQGLLEVVNRPWCDFVIFTFKGMKIERIERNCLFFKEMFPKLKEFYYNYQMPALVGITGEETQKELIFLENGLVNDLAYYKSAVGDRDYTISVFKDVKLPIRELKASDFHSLDGNNWVTNFVLDIVLNLLDETDVFQIIPEEAASYIFNESTENVTEYFLQKVRIIKDRIAMAVRINGNHHCLVIIDYELKRFSFIDPFTTSEAKATVYLKKYRTFMRTYYKHFENDSRDADNLQTYIYGHYKQKDSYNCGPIILDLFHKIINNEDLYQEPDFHLYRMKLQRLLLEKSDCIKNLCLICSARFEQTKSVQCKYCKRYIHEKCVADYQNRSFIENDTCYLCKQY